MRKIFLMKIFVTVISISVVLFAIPFSVSATDMAQYEGIEIFIKTKASSQYMQIDTNGWCNVSIENKNWDNIGPQRWKITMLEYDHYVIESVYNQKFLTVPTNASNGTELSFADIDSTGYARQEWKFIAQSGGGYLIQPKSHENTSLYLSYSNYAVVLSTTATVWDIEQFFMPTSGYELSYNPYVWANDAQDCNCYGYAINNQIDYRFDLYMTWRLQQPGQFANIYIDDPNDYYILDYIHFDANPTYFLEAVEADFEAYSNALNSTYIFQPIGRYETCPAGTYKVALVISPNKDYHWYRQDASGYWSHKQGTTPVSNYDASGNLIIDPQDADRFYDLELNYSIFVGYFAVTPWNSYFVPTNDVPISNLETNLFIEDDSCAMVNAQSISSIEIGMTYEEIAEILGSYGVLKGSGAFLYHYTIDEERYLSIFYTQQNGQLIASNIEIVEGSFEQ